MEFTDEILIKIEAMGADGYSFSSIASELNLTPVMLLDEMKINPGLDRAIKRARINEIYYRKGKIEEMSTHLKSPVQKEMLQRLWQELNEGNDNRIEIERV